MGLDQPREEPSLQGELSQLEQWGGVENEAPENLAGGKSQATLATGNGHWARSKLAENTPRNDAFLLRQWLQVGLRRLGLYLMCEGG